MSNPDDVGRAGKEMTTTDQIKLFLSVLSERNQHLFVIWCAERSLKLVKNPDPRSLAAIEAKKQWLDGKISDEDLEKARKDAWDAWASAAPAYAAYDAYAAAAPTYAAYAVYDAARNKERTAQLCQILTMLGKQLKK